MKCTICNDAPNYKVENYEETITGEEVYLCDWCKANMLPLIAKKELIAKLKITKLTGEYNDTSS